MGANVFIGRAEEQQRLEQALAFASNKQTSLRLLGGEPGIGKTSLARHFEATANDAGFTSCWGRCWEAGSAPAFWPWNDVLRACASIIGDERFKHILTSACPLQDLPDSLRAGLNDSSTGNHSDRQVATLHEGMRLRVFDAVARIVRASCEQQPLLIIFDDLHAADSSSLTLLRYLIRHTPNAPLLIVGAFRIEETEAAEDIRQSVAKLAREGETLELNGLNEADSADLYQTVAGQAISPELAGELRQASGGNPLFFTEFARLKSLGNKSSQQQFPRVLRDILQQRVQLLPTETQQALGVAAVIGREFSTRLLAKACSSSPAEIDERLQPALHANIIEKQVTTDRSMFAVDCHYSHDFFRQFFSDSLPAAERQQLHFTIAEAMEQARAMNGCPPSMIARHYCAALPAGSLPKALGALHLAALDALRSGAYEEVLELSQLSLESMICDDEPHSREATKAHMAAGHAALALGNFKLARRSFSQAFETAAETGSGQLALRAALGYGAMADIGNSGPKLINQLQRGLALIEDDEIMLRSLAKARLAQALLYSFERESAEKHALAARELAKQGKEPLVEAQVLHFTGQALHGVHGLETRIADSRKIIALARRAGNTRIEALGHEELIRHALETGNLMEAEQARATLNQFATELKNNLPSWLAMAHEALRLSMGGRFDEAEALANEALELGSGHSNIAAWITFFSMLHELHWHRNEIEKAIPTMQESCRQLPESSSAHTGLLWAQAYTEPHNSAIAVEFDKYVKNNFADIPKDPYWLASMELLAEAAVVTKNHAAAKVIYRLLLPHASEHALIFHASYRGCIARVLGLIAAALGDYSAADAHLSAAIAAELKLKSPPYECYARLDRVEAILASGRTDRGQEITQELAAVEAKLQTHKLPRAQAQFERLQGLLSSETATPKAVSSASTVVQLNKENDYWSFATAGRIHRLKHSIGLDYLSQLLGRAGVSITAMELVGGTQVSEGAAEHALPQNGSSELLDATAKRQYQQRLEDLQSYIDEAEANNDLGGRAKYEAEKTALLEQLSSALGLGGRARKFSTDGDRARSAATKAIRTAIKKIQSLEPELGQYLQECVKTGKLCEYQPGALQNIHWEIAYSG